MLQSNKRKIRKGPQKMYMIMQNYIEYLN